MRAAWALALTVGRSYATPEDVKAVVEPVWAHRLGPMPAADLSGFSPSSLLSELLGIVPVRTTRPPVVTAR